MSTKKTLPAKQSEKLLKTLQARFEKNKGRHKQVKWADVQAKLEKSPAKLLSLYEMEETGGEPDIIGYEKKTNTYIFCDCSPETPKGRRSICYDQQALTSRKEHKPKNSAINLAKEMGIEILTEEQYRDLQTIGEFDLKSSCWVFTPPEIRKLGGAIFCDRRFGRVFTYHNGAESYYSGRGFRGRLLV